MSTEPTVFIVDDDPAFRESLIRLMDSVGLAVTAFPDAAAFLQAYDPARPGCLVLDVRMPGMSGLELQEVLTGKGGQIPVIVLSAYGDVEQVVRAIKGGAVDFIKKPYKGRVLLERIREALATDARLRRQQDAQSQITARLALLTPREREVMERLLVGQFPKAIAGDLGLSRKTVDVHRGHILMKMGASSTVDLVRMVQYPNGGPRTTAALEPPLGAAPRAVAV